MLDAEDCRREFDIRAYGDEILDALSGSAAAASDAASSSAVEVAPAVDFAANLGASVSLALENARLYDDLAERERLGAALNDISAAIVSFLDSREILESAVARAAAAAVELGRLMVEGANLYLSRVPVRVVPQIMAVWSKAAEPVYDADGALLPWSPPEKGN